METQDLLSLGAGGALAIIVIREVLNFLKSRGQVDDDKVVQELRIEIINKLNRIDRMNKDMYDWYNPKDGYVRRSLEKAVADSTKATEKLTQVLSAMFDELKEVRRDVTELRRRSS